MLQTFNFCLTCLGFTEAELHDLSCDFEEDGCFWYSQGSSEWQRTKGSASDGSWCLEASANVSADGSFILESARFVPSNGTAMFFTYQLIGSNSSITLQGQVGDGNWTRIFAQMSGGNDSWQAGTVRVPSGTVSLRFLASITDAEAIVRVDSIQLVSASAASSLADVTCNFEVDLCGWSKRWYSWELLSGYLRTQFRTYSDEAWSLDCLVFKIASFRCGVRSHSHRTGLRETTSHCPLSAGFEADEPIGWGGFDSTTSLLFVPLLHGNCIAGSCNCQWLDATLVNCRIAGR